MVGTKAVEANSYARIFSMTSRGLLCTKRLCLRVHASFFEVYTSDEIMPV